MKMMCSRRNIATSAGLGLLLASVIAGPAQPEKNEEPVRRPPAGEETGRGQPRMAGGPAGRFVPGIERLQAILTEEQRASLREAMEGQREKMRDLEEKTRAARQGLLMAGLTEKFDEEAVRQKALSAAKLEAEMTVLRARAFSKMRPPLSPEQLEKLKAPPADRGEDRPEPPRRRPEIRRDEHGLPLKDAGPARPEPPEPPPAPKPPQP
jgi:Spy/CpxP family protein refolding chaperone